MARTDGEKISLVYTAPTIPKPFDLLKEMKENLEVEHFVLTLQIIIAIFVLILIIQIIRLINTRKTYLVLRMTNGLQCLNINLFQIETCLTE